MNLGLLARNLPAAVLADIGPFFDDLRAERAFPGKISCMYLFHGLIDSGLKNIVAEFMTADGVDRIQFTDASDDFSSLYTRTRAGSVGSISRLRAVDQSFLT
jgi:hypothetical protein